MTNENMATWVIQRLVNELNDCDNYNTETGEVLDKLCYSSDYKELRAQLRVIGYPLSPYNNIRAVINPIDITVFDDNTERELLIIDIAGLDLSIEELNGMMDDNEELLAFLYDSYWEEILSEVE